METFISTWPEDSIESKKLFIDLKNHLEALEKTELEFHARPGVTYSLRGKHDNQNEKPLFVLVDVIDDTPRWLSVCFYGDMVGDPEEIGNLVPGGLLGDDGLCFDLENTSPELLTYVKDRISDAHLKAAGQ